MKIFYAVQATGNGHISRAMTLLPYLEKRGKVDIFLSGDNSHLTFPEVRYRSRGISLYFDRKGSLSYRKTIRNFRPFEAARDLRQLPVDKYDLVINDFDLITAMACRKKKIPFVHFGHQASFIAREVPRPARKRIHGEWLLKHYAHSPFTTGLHFERYAPFIFEPVIKNEILEATPVDNGHITVYLPSYDPYFLAKLFSYQQRQRFEIFTPETKCIKTYGNTTLFPVSISKFNESFINCHAIICGAGFETPAEAIQMGKKVMVLPINGQYEQECNAAALQRMNIPVVPKLNSEFGTLLRDWLSKDKEYLPRDYSGSISQALEHLFGHFNNAPTPLTILSFQ